MYCTTSVFRKLGYWDDHSKKPVEDKTVTFEHYLELVLGCVIRDGKQQLGVVKSAGSILKRNGTFSGSMQSLPEPAGADAAQDVSEPSSPVKVESLKFRFPDDPTADQLEQEWQIFLEHEKKKHKHQDHADEGTAFKVVKAAEKGDVVQYETSPDAAMVKAAEKGHVVQESTGPDTAVVKAAEIGDDAQDEISPDAAEAHAPMGAAATQEEELSAAQAVESDKRPAEQECTAPAPSEAADGHGKGDKVHDAPTSAAGDTSDGDKNRECAQAESSATGKWSYSWNASRKGESTDPFILIPSRFAPLFLFNNSSAIHHLAVVLVKLYSLLRFPR